MSNHICCIITVQQKDYQYIASRLSTFGFILTERKQLQFSLMVPLPKKKEEGQKKFSRKYQSPLIRLTQGNNSTYLFYPQPNKVVDEKLIYEATYLRSENSSINMIKDWNFYKDLKEKYNKKFELQVYNCKQVFQLQFYHSDAEDQKVLMIMNDLTSCSLIQKNPYIDREGWKNKMIQHFRDLFSMLSSGYQESNQFEVPFNNQTNFQKTKSYEFDQICKIYVQKIVAMQNAQANIQNPSLNPTQKGFYKTMRTACIVQFILAEQQQKKQ